MPGLAVVSGARVVLADGVRDVDIIIDDGRVAALAGDAGEVSGERLDAAGKVVFPGGVDIHTHLREPSKAQREGFGPGTASAVAGGITTVGEMPQADPLVKDPASLATKRELAERASLCDFALYSAATGQTLEELRELQDLGVRAFKAYMCASSPGYPRLDDAALLQALEHLAELDALLIVHAENDSLLQAGLARMAAAGRTDPLAHAESRPPLVESEAIARVVRFATHTGTRLHVAHVSTPDGAEIVRAAKAAGARVTCETCPQYLLMDHDDLVRLGPWARCAPAIRARADVERLWDYVLDGTIDSLGSDHSPYTREEKQAGAGDIFKAPLGINIIQAMLPAVRDEAVNRRGMTLERFAQLSATRPAQIVGLHPAKGEIAVGADADLAVWDLDATWEVRAEDLFSRHPWTALEGREVRGRVTHTIRRGEVVFADGAVPAGAGGHFLAGATAAVAG
jgi:allantoinase